MNNMMRSTMSEAIFQQPRPRVNGAMLSQFDKKPVCLLGYASEPASSGMMFKLKTTDDHLVQIHLQEPLQDHVDGWVEVQGVVMSKTAVKCAMFVPFPADYTQGFDPAHYNEAVKLLQQVSSV